MARHWYILHTYSGYENKVKQGIDRLARVDLADVVYDVKIPVESVIEMRSGKKRETKKKFFPGYILVEMEIPEDEQLWKAAYQRIRGITGVTGFLGSTRTTRPSPVANEDVYHVLAKMGEIKSAEVKPTVRINFSMGDQVTVVDGPFKDFKGVVEEINQEKGTIRVKVEIFGRATPVELSFTQAERL